MTEHSANDHDCAEGTEQPKKLEQADPTEELTAAERDYRFMRTGLDQVPDYWDLIDDYALNLEYHDFLTRP